MAKKDGPYEILAWIITSFMILAVTLIPVATVFGLIRFIIFLIQG